MDRKRVLIYTLVALVILSATGYYIYQHAIQLRLAKPELILKVSMSSDSGPTISNITFEQSSVPFFYKTTDTAPQFPEIQVNARLNQVSSAPASYWAATPFKGDGEYILRVFFRDGQEPKKDDVLILPVRVVGYRGDELFITTAFWVWE